MTTLRCGIDTPTLSFDAARAAVAATLPDWSLSDDGTTIERTITTKGFAKATYLAGLAVFLADKSGHHPDMSLGWGYFTIRYTTHDAGGLTQVDLNCATQFDKLVA
jgi:4a-hydroxytetrahydrobiopterin dehydratase